MKKEQTKALSREEVAAIEVGHTTVSPRLASLTTLAFLAVILSVPVFQHVEDVRTYLVGVRSTPWPQSLEIFSALGELPKVGRGESVLKRVFAGNSYLLESINDYESRLDSRSMLSRDFAQSCPGGSVTLFRCG
jgi:hypothetical protein